MGELLSEINIHGRVSHAWPRVGPGFMCTSSPGILRQPPLTRQEERNIFSTFSVHVCLMCLKLGDIKKESKKMKLCCLSFYKAELKSEVRYVYLGWSGLSVLLQCLLKVKSKHFNHSHPYIEITTRISDYSSKYIDIESISVKTLFAHLSKQSVGRVSCRKMDKRSPGSK